MDMMLNPNIGEFINPIVESFVEVYGEEYRHLVVERINNVDIMFYNEPTKLGSYITKIKQAKRKELLIDFIKKIGVKLNNEDEKALMAGYGENPYLKNFLDCYFGWNKSVDSKMEGLDAFKKEYDERLLNDDIGSYAKKNIISSRVKLLSFLGFEVSAEDYTNDNYDKDEKYRTIMNTINCHLELKSIFETNLDEYESTLQPYEDYVKYEKDREREIEHKKITEFMNEIGDILTEEEKKAIRNADTYNLNSIKSVRMYACSYGFNGDAYIDFFSKDKREKLLNPKCSDYDRKNIIEGQVNFLKGLGVNINIDNYNEYINDPKVIKLIPSYDEIERIVEIRSRKRNESKEEYIKGTSDFISIQEQLKRLNLTYNTFSYDMMDKNINCISPNEQITQCGPLIKPSMYFTTTGALPGYIDVQFIHELVHVVELTKVLKRDEKETVFLCGFDVVAVSEEEEIDDGIKREYEYINEILTQMVAMEVTSKLQQKGIYMFENKCDTKIKGGTSYEQGNMFLMLPFEKYRRELIDAKITGDMEVLYDKIGKDNLIRLNQLINEYFKLPYYNLMTAIMNKEENNPLVLEFNQLAGAAKRVYASMEEVYKLSTGGHSL